MSKINEQINEFETETLDELAKQKYELNENSNWNFEMSHRV